MDIEKDSVQELTKPSFDTADSEPFFLDDNHVAYFHHDSESKEEVDQLFVLDLNDKDQKPYQLTKDRKKLAKNLKLMINNIYKLNISGGSHITKIKLYGVQLYQKQFYIYSLQMFCPKVYVFKEELRFDYPTSPALFRSRLPLFFKNMLYMKNCIESSLENIMIYINATDTARSSNEHFTDSTNNSPVKKKN